MSENLTPEVLADLKAKALDFTAPPFADNGIGGVMLARGETYLDEYVLSVDDGPDYEPDDDERELLQDFMAGLLNDEAMFGPVRALLNDRNALHARARELAEIAMGNGQEIGRLLIENASLTARAEKAEQHAEERQAVVDAARIYFNDYMQDEADESYDFLGVCDEAKHKAASALGDALTFLSPNKSEADSNV